MHFRGNKIIIVDCTPNSFDAEIWPPKHENNESCIEIISIISLELQVNLRIAIYGHTWKIRIIYLTLCFNILADTSRLHHESIQSKC